LEPCYDFSEVQALVWQQQVLSIDTDGQTRIGHLADLLRQMEKQNDLFPSDFIEFATGCRFLPQQGAQIKVKFNHLEMQDNSLVEAHTCPRVIKLPGKAYRADAVILGEKLKMSVDNSVGSFNQN
jgi:hypothetical protein